MRPQLQSLGWLPDLLPGERAAYRHTSGATAARRCYHDHETDRLVFEASVNGGPWTETGERFHSKTLKYLEAAVRARPIQRALHCPACHGRSFTGVPSPSGVYRCAGCGSEFAGLAGLEVIGG
jgi:ribosomal protein L37AE/L43A